MTQTVDAKTQTPEFFHQAAENFKSAMDTTLKCQQDAFKTMSEFFGKGESFSEARERFEDVATDSLNLVRKNAEQAQKYFDEGCKTGLEVIRKTFDATENGNGKRDFFVQARDVWQSAFDAMRSSVESAARANAQAIENWSNFFSKSMTVGEKKSAK
jgi:uncharacterized protein with ATP-grasp and redox domains